MKRAYNVIALCSNSLALCVRGALAFVGIKNKKNHGVLPERQNRYQMSNEEVKERSKYYSKMPS